MDEIEKLLRKMKKADRERLISVMVALIAGATEGLHIKKLSGSNLYRVRVGDFRIVFSIDRATKKILIESVRLRNEGTCR